MYIKPVHCSFCKAAKGLYFETTNIEGNQFLLNKLALNMSSLELSHKTSMKMKKIINQLFDLLDAAEKEKAENKV